VAVVHAADEVNVGIEEEKPGDLTPEAFRRKASLRREGEQIPLSLWERAGVNTCDLSRSVSGKMLRILD